MKKGSGSAKYVSNSFFCAYDIIKHLKNLQDSNSKSKQKYELCIVKSELPSQLMTELVITQTNIPPEKIEFDNFSSKVKAHEQN